jgi:serine/threonine-protein kinase
MSEFEAGAIIDGRYRVLSRVGAGGMADVYLAQDEQLGRQVALKLLHRRFAEDPGFVERFRREAQAAASLQHPNVVSVFDRGSFEGTYYIAMEYLQGRSLKALIREEAPLDPLRAIDITIQILKAARFAHRRGVIHRDLKPHNVIIDDNDHAKVTDFGIARAGASDMTETGSIMGTAQYLSPEQAQGQPVTAPSDLYSVGVVLYEMLTGRVPFDGESAVTIALKHVSAAPLPPRQINPQIPPALEQAVLWALNKNPEDRPADADEFISVLSQVREQIAAGPVGEVTASMRALPPGSLSAAGALVPVNEPPTTAMPSTEVLGHYVLSQQHTFDGERVNQYDGEDPDDKDRGPGIWPWLVALLILLLLAGGAAAFLLTRPKQQSVPTVVGLTLNVAQSKVQTAGFTPNILYEHSTSPRNSVIGQSPLGGARVDANSTVTLTVSEGRGSVIIPSVTELPQADAIKLLKHAQIKVSRILTQYSANVPGGYALSTEPEAGTSITKGSSVVLNVSRGRRPIAAVSVPYVIGFSVANAETSLAKFRVAVQQQTSGAQAPGHVLSQDPISGTLLKPGSSVTITVADAPPVKTTTTHTTTTPSSIPVPLVVGYTGAAAKRALIAAGFKVTESQQSTPVASQAGLVVSQAPNSGRKVAPGTVIAIAIGKYKPLNTPTKTTPTPGKTTSTPTPGKTTSTPTAPATTPSTPTTTPKTSSTSTSTSTSTP